MEYNTCGTCGAKDGRAGLLISSDLNNHIPECGNCYDTRKSRAISIHTNLRRTDEEIKKTMDILAENQHEKLMNIAKKIKELNIS